MPQIENPGSDSSDANNTLLRQNQYLACLAEISANLLSSQDFNITLPHILKHLLDISNADRCYLFENHCDPLGILHTSQRFEVCKDGITSQRNNPDNQGIPWVEGGMGRWVEIMPKGESICGPISQFPESERQILEPQNILWLLALPLIVNGKWYGFIGFDACIPGVEWTSQEISLLRTAANTISAAIERKQAFDELREREEKERCFQERLKDLNLVSIELTEIDSFNKLCYKAVQMAHQRLGFDRLGIWFIDPDDPDRVVGSYGIDETGQIRDERNAHFKLSEHIEVQKLCQEKRQYVLLKQHHLTNQNHNTVGYGQLLYASMFDVNGYIGFIFVDNFLSRKNLQPTDCELLCLFANTVGHLSSKIKSHEAIQRAKKEWELTFDSVPDFICILDTKFKIVRVNQAMADRLGVSPSEAVGKTCFQCVHNTDTPPHYCPHYKLLKDGKEHFEEVYEKNLGGWFWVTVSPIYNEEGQIQGSIHVAHDINQRKMAEQNLKEKDERFNQLAGNLKEIFWISTPRFEEVIYLSPAFETVFGLSRDTIYDNPLAWIDLIVKEDREMILNEIHKKDNDYSNPEVPEYRIRRPDGLIRWIKSSAFPIRNEQDQLYRIAGIASDVTDQKNNETLMRIQRNIALALSSTAELKDALSQLLEELLMVDGIDCGGIYFIDSDGALDLTAHKGLSTEFVDLAMHYDADSPNARLAALGDIQYKHADEFIQASLEILHKEKILSLAVIPVKYEEKTVAVLNLASRIYENIPIHARSTLEGIASQIGSSIARVKAESNVNALKTNLQNLFDTIDDFLFILDINGQILHTNPVVQERLGYSEDDLHAMKVIEVHPPDQREKAMEIVGAMLAGEATHCPIPLLTNKGELIPVETKVTLGKWNGQDVIFGISRDITEQKKARETLVKSEQMYRSAIEVADAVPYYQNYINNTYEFVGPGIQALTGYTPEEFTYEIWSLLEQEIIPLGELAGLSPDKAIKKAQEGEGTSWRADYRIKIRSGEERWIANAAVQVRNDHGRIIGSLGILQDITERKQAQKAIEESERLYRSAIEVADAVPYYQNYASNKYEFIGPGILHLTGYPPEEFSYEIWISITQEVVLLGDLSELTPNEAVAKAKEGKGISWRADYRIKTRSGEERWLANAAVQVRDDRGKVVGSLGILQDITDSKQAVIALRQSEEKYRGIFETIQDVYTETAIDGTILEVSPSVEKISGYKREDLIGKPVVKLYANPDDRSKFFNAIKQTGHVTDYEVLLKDKDEQEVCCSFSSSLITDNQGTPLKTVGTLRDVSERKQAEKRIEGLNQLKEGLLYPGGLTQKLQLITDRVAEIFKADFARIWIINPGDRCGSGCFHAEENDGFHQCINRDQCLHLLASSGRYTHTDGHVHRRVPFGCYKIGRIAAGQETKFLTNDVINDPKIHDHKWAKKLGLVSFAGYRLLSDTKETIGVFALFSKNVITPEENGLLENVSGTIAQVIKMARADEELRQYAETQSTLVREVNHRVKNNLSAIISMIHKEEDRAGQEGQSASLPLLHTLENRINGLATVHSMLSSSGWRPLLISDICREVTQAAVKAIPLSQKAHIDIQPSLLVVGSTQAHYLALIINELATNSLKHALRDQNTIHLRIRVQSDETQTLICFQDDGPGYPEEILAGDFSQVGIGFDLIQGIIKKSLNGSFLIKNDNGAKITISFKNI